MCTTTPGAEFLNTKSSNHKVKVDESDQVEKVRFPIQKYLYSKGKNEPRI
jgi:hypothetical protein